MSMVHAKTFEVHFYETDFEWRADLLSLLDYLQHSAGEHAALLRFAVTDLAKLGLTWVLSRYHVRVFEQPRLGDRVTVTTWPSGRRGLFALRDFAVTDAAGRRLAAATSSWMILQVERKQPVPIDDVLPQYAPGGERALEDAFGRLPEPAAPGLELPFRVEFRDLDYNRHVNHTVYIRWALESVPPDVLMSRRPLEIEVAYKAEAFYGDEVVSQTEALPDGRTFLHRILNRTTGAELTRLRTIWEG